MASLCITSCDNGSYEAVCLVDSYSTSGVWSDSLPYFKFALKLVKESI